MSVRRRKEYLLEKEGVLQVTPKEYWKGSMWAPVLKQHQSPQSCTKVYSLCVDHSFRIEWTTLDQDEDAVLEMFASPSKYRKGKMCSRSRLKCCGYGRCHFFKTGRVAVLNVSACNTEQIVYCALHHKTCLLLIVGTRVNLLYHVASKDSIKELMGYKHVT